MFLGNSHRDVYLAKCFMLVEILQICIMLWWSSGVHCRICHKPDSLASLRKYFVHGYGQVLAVTEGYIYIYQYCKIWLLNIARMMNISWHHVKLLT